MELNKINPIHSFIDKLLSVDPSTANKAKYTVLQMSCVFVHFTLIFVFAAAGVLPMVIFNIASTIIYIACGILVKAEKYILLYCITFIEICLHSYTATILVGWTPGFPLYIIATMPIIFYMHFSLNENSTLRETFLIGIVSALTFVTCKILSLRIEPIYEINGIAAHCIYIYNALCTFAMLLFFSIMFLREIQNSQADLERRNEILDMIAGSDALTGLYNRRSMDKFINSAVNSGKTYSLIMCDLDDFKHINDTYGHKAGDMVLKNISGLIAASLRDDDYVCRWGGEEILILTTEVTLSAAASVAERIRAQVEEMTVRYKDNDIKCTMTIGAAESGECESSDEVINLADTRLYKGKKCGKNCVIIS